MIKIAVTGGIGSGKSYISHLLENMHIPVYNADNEAKRLTVSDAGIRGELIALLGEEVYKDGLLNKPLLASYLFSDPAHVLQINSIIHPRVRKDFTVWVERQEKCEIVGMESAILYEAGFQDTVDAVIMVYAPVDSVPCIVTEPARNKSGHVLLPRWMMKKSVGGPISRW